MLDNPLGSKEKLKHRNADTLKFYAAFGTSEMRTTVRLVARYAPGSKAKLINQSQGEALDNPLGCIEKLKRRNSDTLKSNTWLRSWR